MRSTGSTRWSANSIDECETCLLQQCGKTCSCTLFAANQHHRGDIRLGGENEVRARSTKFLLDHNRLALGGMNYPPEACADQRRLQASRSGMVRSWGGELRAAPSTATAQFTSSLEQTICDQQSFMSLP